MAATRMLIRYPFLDSSRTHRAAPNNYSIGMYVQRREVSTILSKIDYNAQAQQ